MVSFDRGQRKFTADLLKSICLLASAGVGYQYLNGSLKDVLTMTAFAFTVGIAGILYSKGTEEELTKVNLN